MAKTSTPVYKQQAVTSIDNASGTLTDITSTNSTITVALQRQSSETYVFGDDTAIQGIGKSTGTVSGTIVYSTNAAEARAMYNEWYFTSEGAARTVTIDVPDSASGSDRYSGELVLNSFTPVDGDAGSGELMMMQVEMKGPISWTIIA